MVIVIINKRSNINKNNGIENFKLINIDLDYLL